MTAGLRSFARSNRPCTRCSDSPASDICLGNLSRCAVFSCVPITTPAHTEPLRQQIRRRCGQKRRTRFSCDSLGEMRLSSAWRLPKNVREGDTHRAPSQFTASTLIAPLRCEYATHPIQQYTPPRSTVTGKEVRKLCWQNNSLFECVLCDVKGVNSMKGATAHCSIVRITLAESRPATSSHLTPGLIYTKAGTVHNRGRGPANSAFGEAIKKTPSYRTMSVLSSASLCSSSVLLVLLFVGARRSCEDRWRRGTRRYLVSSCSIDKTFTTHHPCVLLPLSQVGICFSLLFQRVIMRTKQSSRLKSPPKCASDNTHPHSADSIQVIRLRKPLQQDKKWAIERVSFIITTSGALEHAHSLLTSAGGRHWAL
jgi:hypothetical protein